MKRILALLLVVITASAAQAQFKAGVKAGANYSNVIYNELEYTDSKNKLGFHGGVYAQVPLYKKLFLQPELLYSIKGFRFSATDYGNFTAPKGTNNFRYLSLPVLLGYEITDKLSVVAGAEFAALLKVMQKIGDQKNELRNFYNPVMDIGISAGANYTVSKALGVHARYTYGFTPMLEITYRDSNGKAIKNVTDGYHSNFQLGLYYNIIK